MERPHISADDIMDVMELTKKIEQHIFTVLLDNDRNLALSALMSASINCVLSQCETFEEVILYRNLFIKILDLAVGSIEVKFPDQTSS